MLAMVGLQTFDSVPLALAALAIFIALVTISAEVVTPYVLGRGLLLNPVAIFIAIMLWGWLWGIVGVLLAVPLLASFKIICERVEPLHPIADHLVCWLPPPRMSTIASHSATHSLYLRPIL
jgi:predicted PurR-regulated permease PerM